MQQVKAQIANPKLVHGLKAGNPLAFREVFMLFEKRLHLFVLSITKSEYIAEEIIQEVFIKVWMNKDELNTDLSFDSYIFTLTRNLTYNYLRDAARREAIRAELWENITVHHQQVDADLIFEEYKEIVDDIVRNLPQQKRSIYHLSRKQGKSNSEIADILGITPKTVKNHLWSIMSTIRSQLKPYMEETLRILILIFFL